MMMWRVSLTTLPNSLYSGLPFQQSYQLHNSKADSLLTAEHAHQTSRRGSKNVQPFSTLEKKIAGREEELPITIGGWDLTI